MFPAENLWLVITIPVAIVISLIFVKVGQKRLNKHAGKSSAGDAVHTGKMHATLPVTHRSLSEPVRNAQQKETKHGNQDRPENCQKFLGYLYMRQGSEKTYIPTECYDCSRLLQCMYSPNAIERVYGQ